METKNVKKEKSTKRTTKEKVVVKQKASRLTRDVSLKLQLNDEQKKVHTDFLSYNFTFITGDYGSGKTAVACAIALKSLLKNDFTKIVISRPILRNKLGYLPGEIEGKMKPWVAPIVHNLCQFYDKGKVEEMMKRGDIIIEPLDYLKGITFMNSIVIIDEFQDTTYEEFRTIVTRLGKDSKIIFCGSKEQIDKSIGKESCYNRIKDLEGTGLAAWHTLKANHRHPDIDGIINFLEKK